MGRHLRRRARLHDPSEAQLSLLAELTGDGGQWSSASAPDGCPAAGRPWRTGGGPRHLAVDGGRLRSKPGGTHLPVTVGDMVEPHVEGPFRLVYVVFNTFFALLAQDDQVYCFQAVARVLEPEGTFLLECFVPDLCRFDRGQSLRTLRVSDGDVRIDTSRHDPVNQRVSSNVVHIVNGSVSVRPVRLRYAWPAELDLMATLAGLHLDHRWHGWGQRPFSAASANHISLYRRDRPRWRAMPSEG